MSLKRPPSTKSKRIPYLNNVVQTGGISRVSGGVTQMRIWVLLQLNVGHDNTNGNVPGVGSGELQPSPKGCCALFLPRGVGESGPYLSTADGSVRLPWGERRGGFLSSIIRLNRGLVCAENSWLSAQN